MSFGVNQPPSNKGIISTSLKLTSLTRRMTKQEDVGNSEDRYF